MPSPKNQTPSAQPKETTSAGRTVGRKNSPNPMANWSVANKALNAAASGETKCPAWVISQAMGAGCPTAFAVR